MLSKIVDTVKGWLVGKGSSQIGSRNIAVSVGQDAKHLNVANEINITNHPTPTTTPIPPFEPRPQEIEILTRIAESADKTLHLVKVDTQAGYMVLIDIQPIRDVDQTESCLECIEAVSRLREAKLLLNHSGDGQLFHLSNSGQELARRFRGQCLGCGRSMVNEGPDPSQPPQWACRNSRCLRSAWHADTKCPKCGNPPAKITNGGVNFTSFLCLDGHPFTTKPSRK